MSYILISVALSENGALLPTPIWDAIQANSKGITSLPSASKAPYIIFFLLILFPITILLFINLVENSLYEKMGDDELKKYEKWLNDGEF